jgi:hypothetical protein
LERGGQVAHEFMILRLMEKYGWTYQQYLDQPDWLIQFAHAKLSAEDSFSSESQKRL